MSISDRLDQIDSVAAYLDDDDMESEVLAATAALRAVLEVCNETTIEARPHGGGEPYMIVPVREVYAAISAALGEES